MTGVNEIRSTFLDYFASYGHEKVASSALVPSNDPTLLFTNAGMVQFKNVFTGQERRPYNRAVTSQKCVRAGGKHNDLDNVGFTARHHTFFEMLGNFSFGDYFKADAIELAWNLITKQFGLAAEKLLVTVYHTDDEAHELWRKVAGLGDDRIIRIPTSDNFWAMGDTGPCGPCSEIFYDHGEHIPGGPPGSPDEDGDRFIEIWNLVFMQYERERDGSGEIVERDLPRPSIDTGMGLERIAAVLQGVHDNYDIDLFQALIAASVEATGRAAEGDAVPSHRVIADHLRASAFLIADGVLPSNEGRGYVLRRIMRRAMRHGQLLGAAEPLMHRLVPALTREMGGAYPELVRAEPLVRETLKLEETRFRRTLERGLTLLDEATADLGEGDRLDGETAFKLYDTYGFPLDLTQDALRRRGVGVDTDAFNAAMARQKAEARANWKGSGDTATEAVWLDLSEKLGATEFLGYVEERAEGIVTAIVNEAGESTEHVEPGANVRVVLNQTPFYAESGGQQGDTGTLRGERGVLTVTDTRKVGGMFIHHAVLEGGEIAVGDAVEAEVDHRRRDGLRANHSATHLVHEALREVLGEHVAQKGSLVAPDRLRFDFSHPKGMSEDEIARVEEIANAVVRQNAPVETRLMGVEEAIAEGARALFGEKYGDEVRVVSMGTAIREDRKVPYSIELCGGTHVRATGDVGAITIQSESGVSSGVRRIEALSGEAALKHFTERDRQVRDIANALKVSTEEAPARVRALVEERRAMERELADLRKRMAMVDASGGGGSDSGPEDVNGTAFVGRVLEGVSPKELKGLVDETKRDIGSGIIALIAVNDGKASVVVGVTQDLTGEHDAVELVRTASAALGGKGGGGRPDMAQAGGPDGAKASDAIDALRDALGKRVAEAAE